MDRKFMDIALVRAKHAAADGEVPVGAIIVCNGEIIATGNTFNLRENSSKLGSYVRFQIKNDGGIVMSQPFVCDDGNMEAKMIPETVVEPLNFFEKLVAAVRKTILGELFYRMFWL